MLKYEFDRDAGAAYHRFANQDFRIDDDSVFLCCARWSFVLSSCPDSRRSIVECIGKRRRHIALYWGPFATIQAR